jgi:hypothetical protein
MTTRQLFIGGAFLALGVIVLICNRFLTSEGLRWQSVFSWMSWLKVTPAIARVLVIAWGFASLILGTLLLTGALK